MNNARKQIRIALVGRTGRMGREIEKVANEYNLEIVAGVGRGDKLKLALEQNRAIDMVIDFSLANATKDIVQTCSELNMPLVTGVTGISIDDKATMIEAGKKIPLLYSANMSLGIQVLKKALSSFKGLKGFEFVIEEAHHKHKKDRPSGTALLLKEALKEKADQDCGDIISIRGGGIVGEHRVLALGESEVIMLSHQAISRAVFARGACHAARWLMERPAGFYSLEDSLIDLPDHVVQT